MGSISYISNALGGTLTTTSFSITLPTTQAGDLIILEFTHRGTGDGTIGGTSGLTWTLKHSQLYGSSLFSGKTYWARATGNHSGQTVTGSGLTNSCAAIVTVYRGALQVGDPLGDATVVGEQNASGDETQAEITTQTDGAYVVLVVVNSPDLAVSTQSSTSPGTLTERAERLSTGGTDTSIAHASAEKASAGGTGNLTWAQTNAASGSWAYAIRPTKAIPYSDTYTRADSTNLGLDYAETAGDFSVASNALTCTSAPAIVLMTGVDTHADGRVVATVKGNFTAGIYGRVLGSNYVLAYYDSSTGGLALLEHNESVSPTETTLALATGVSFTAGDTFEFQYAGPWLAAFKNGVLLCSNAGGAQTTVTAAGWAGYFAGSTSFSVETTAINAASVSASLSQTDATDTISATAEISLAGISASLSLVDDTDVASATGALAIAGTLSQSDAEDSLAATAGLGIAASLAQTDAEDTSTAAAGLGIAATLSQTDADDTSTAAAGLGIAASLAVTDEEDSADAEGVVGYAPLTATLAVTDDEDSLAATAGLGIAASLAQTDAEDALVSSGAVSLSGAVSAQDEDDACSAEATVGSPVITATLSQTDADDTSTAAAGLGIAASLARTDEGDTGSAAAGVGIAGTLSQSDAEDSLAATAGLGIAASLAQTDAEDSVSSAGALSVSAAVSAQDSDDGLVATGALGIVGALLQVDAQDASSSEAALRIAAALAANDEDDSLVAFANTGAPISGVVDQVDQEDVLSAAGTVPLPAVPPSVGGAGGGKVRTRRRRLTTETFTSPEFIAPQPQKVILASAAVVEENDSCVSTATISGLSREDKQRRARALALLLAA